VRRTKPSSKGGPLLLLLLLLPPLLEKHQTIHSQDRRMGMDHKILSCSQTDGQTWTPYADNMNSRSRCVVEKKKLRVGRLNRRESRSTKPIFDGSRRPKTPRGLHSKVILRQHIPKTVDPHLPTMQPQSSILLYHRVQQIRILTHTFHLP